MDLENLIVADSEDQDGQKVDKRSVQPQVWTEEQEICILNGLIKFSTKKEIDPLKHKKRFFSYIRGSLAVEEEFTLSQLNDKLKSLQKKFKNNLNKGKGISTPHENRLFELSKKIWGDDIKSVPATTEANIEKFGELGENKIEQVLEQLGEAKRIEFKKEWDELQILELKLSVKRAELVQFQSEIMLDAMMKKFATN